MKPGQINKTLLFREQLLAWFAQHHRPLPWKGEKDPYKIWLSEIILQQTRVEQGLPYYRRFVEHFPTIEHLARAPEDQVLKLWQGLGYYARARNMHATAKHIANERDGVFPNDFESIRSLKGVGDYTAAAIASFAFNLPHAVVDGNVYRVLARYFGVETPVDTPAAKKEFTTLAQSVLDTERPGDFNQAIMDFGATHCKPQQPECANCNLRQHCEAYLGGRIESLPRKSKSKEKKERFFLYFVMRSGNQVLVRKRTEKDIWKNLYEFPLLETDTFPTDNREVVKKLLDHFFPGALPAGCQVLSVSKPYRQTLTHRLVNAVFCELGCPAGFFTSVPVSERFEQCTPVSAAELEKNIAVPRIIDWYLQEKALTLRLI
ncbi:MAG: A/G-specific adenine glycosylase [Lewinellaceae bacterium]|nr:A/G-specific adenine glycosylase [Lewinellaceae bacterium]